MPEFLGKREPERGPLKEVYLSGFHAIELYLERAHLDNFGEAVRACEGASVDVETVHTPHVEVGEMKYIQFANNLAAVLDAVLVVHSSSIPFEELDRVEREVEFTVEYAFENQTGYDKAYMGEMLFDEDRQLVLDIAHLYRTLGDAWFEEFEALIDEHIENIPVIHFCDSTADVDGVAIGAGEMELEPALRRLDGEDVRVVLEVPVDEQEAAYDWVLERR